MPKLYQYEYDNGLMDGVVYISKDGSTWTSTIMNVKYTRLKPCASFGGKHNR